MLIFVDRQEDGEALARLAALDRVERALPFVPLHRRRGEARRLEHVLAIELQPRVDIPRQRHQPPVDAVGVDHARELAVDQRLHRAPAPARSRRSRSVRKSSYCRPGRDRGANRRRNRSAISRAPRSTAAAGCAGRCGAPPGKAASKAGRFSASAPIAHMSSPLVALARAAGDERQRRHPRHQGAPRQHHARSSQPPVKPARRRPAMTGALRRIALPDEIVALVGDHRHDRALVDAEIIAVDPAQPGDDPPVEQGLARRPARPASG